MATKIGNNAANTIKGTSLLDKLLGNGGNDTISGKAGNDKIDGGSGKDVINGGAGDDWLIGGSGNDKLTGGTGSDVFSFKSGSGVDRITDFSVTEDKLAIKAGVNGIQTANDVLDHATAGVDAHGNPTVSINLGGGNKIILQNVSLDDLIGDPSAHFVVI